MVLHIFITHLKNLNKSYFRIKNMMKEDFIVVCGGNIKDEYDDNIKVLKLNCNDSYVGLPEKVMKTFHFLLQDPRFNHFTHFIKLDDDIIVTSVFNNPLYDYFGSVCWEEENRRWHMNKNTGTFWDYTPYQGHYEPFCLGGYGYGVSRNALEKIIPNHNYTTHIYEDVYIGLELNKVGIVPINIKTKKFWNNPDHF